jgi:hypothetical protein
MKPDYPSLSNLKKQAWDTEKQGNRSTQRLRPASYYIAEEDLTFKERVWRLMDDPSSSRKAQILAIFIMLLITVSGTAFVLETVPDFDSVDASTWDTIEWVCVLCFSVEFSVRVTFCPSIVKFSKDILNWIDFIAIAPFYMEQILSREGTSSGGSSSSAVFRVIRLIRIFRVFKISRYVTWVSVFYDALKSSAHPLGMLLYIMAVALVIFSTAMHYAERGTLDLNTNTYRRSDGKPSPFNSIPAAFWWCIITMTTVGYGDDVPITGTGR